MFQVGRDQGRPSMMFTEAERKLLDRLNKRQQQWKTARWVLLLCGVWMIGLSAYFLIQLWLELRQEHLLVLLIALVAPVSAFFLFAGLLTVGWVGWLWRGRPETKLLLRLVEQSDRG